MTSQNELSIQLHRELRGGVVSYYMKPVACMTAAEINKHLDKLALKSTKLNDRFIAAGRGDETAEETYKLSDPLAAEFKALSAARHLLQAEIALRYGPGAPSRLPKGRGFGPRRRWS